MGDLTAYAQATAALTDALEAVHTAADARAIALADLHTAGRSYADIAQLVGISRQQVAKLVAHGRQLLGGPRLVRPPKPPATKTLPTIAPLRWDVDF